MESLASALLLIELGECSMCFQCVRFSTCVSCHPRNRLVTIEYGKRVSVSFWSPRGHRKGKKVSPRSFVRFFSNEQCPLWL